MTVTIKFNSSPQDQASKPSYADALTCAQSLNMGSPPVEITGALAQIALGQFKPMELELLIQAVQGATKLPKKALRQQLKVIEQELGLVPNDFALEVARTVRKKHFNVNTGAILVHGNGQVI